MSEMIGKPKHRHDHEGAHEHRHVTWLELFYDLAFVAAVSVIGHQLTQAESWQAVFGSVMLFIPVWWAWLGDAIYNNRFDPEDHSHQFITLLQMVGVVGLAIFAHDGLATGFVGFAVSFIWVRAILAFLFYRVGRIDSDAQKLSFFLAKWIVISLAFWVAAIFVEEPLRFWLAGIGLFVDLVAPFFIAKEQQRVAINADHFIQRFGFFVIIILGEILLFTSGAVIEAGFTERRLVLAAMSIALTFSIWWMYFENDNGIKVIRNFFSETGRLRQQAALAGYAWVYSHLPLSMGLIAMAVGIERTILIGPDSVLSLRRTFLLALGAIIALISIGIMQLTAKHSEKMQRLKHFELALPFLSSTAIALLTVFAKFTDPIMLLGGLTIICFVQVAIQELIEHQIHHNHRHHHHH